MWNLLSASVFLTLLLTTQLIEVDSCNEAVCGSVVSKCLLTQACKCDLNNYSTCGKECYQCLSYLFSECCSCVDMCPKPNETGNSLTRKSYVEDFPEYAADLFRALTEAPDMQNRWNSTTFPIDIDITQHSNRKETKIYMQSAEQEVVPMKPIITLNCTVAFMSECMGLNKCKSSCSSMGAKSFRWFHDGCCECIGQNCINYGINESRCKNCPYNNGEEEEEDENFTDYDDYDEDNDPTNEED